MSVMTPGAMLFITAPMFISFSAVTCLIPYVIISKYFILKEFSSSRRYKGYFLNLCAQIPVGIYWILAQTDNKFKFWSIITILSISISIMVCAFLKFSWNSEINE